MTEECYKITNAIIELEFIVDSNVYYPVQVCIGEDDYGYPIMSTDLQFDSTVSRARFDETINFSELKHHSDWYTWFNDVHIEKTLQMKKN